MDEKALAIAEAQAAMDRDMLARLVASGKVIRQGRASALTRDIEQRMHPKRQINLAIRPKRKKGKRK